MLHALLCIAFLLAGLLASGEARAQTTGQLVSNTAEALWSDSGQPQSVRSNTVDFRVVPVSVKLETFAAAAGDSTLTFASSQCGGGQLTPGSGGVSQELIAGVTASTQVRIGGIFYFRVTLPQANVDPAAVDKLETMLVTQSGDTEKITIFETAPDSGIFVGAVPTSAIPPDPVSGDCRLSVSPGDTISILCHETGSETTLATARMEVLADPYGLVFDSEDGAPVNGARVTLIDADTGAPAKVYGPDGITVWPSSMITGQAVTDAAGHSEMLPAGEYKFPLVVSGHYRVQIEPPDPYTGPSKVPADQLARLQRPDGSPLVLVPASTGGVLTIDSQTPVRVDIPLDRPPVPLQITKTVSRQVAQPGDALFYTITVRNADATHAKRDVALTDRPASVLHLRAGSVRIDGVARPDAVTVSPAGDALTMALGTVGPGATRRITYVATVAPDARPGPAINKATVTDSRGTSATSGASVVIQEDGLTSRMTLMGRVLSGDCEAKPVGVAGVQVVLEDGSFAITDSEGRYHFDGLLPGSHVVQVLDNTLPEGGHFVDCTRTTRAAGSAVTRFVDGQGGTLAIADFHARLPEVTSKPETVADAAHELVSDKAAAGGEIDWLAMIDGPPAFLFPAPDHNPRAPAVRVAIRHRADQKVELSADGKPVDRVAFDMAKFNADKTQAISLWRGIPLEGDVTHLTAVVRNPDGTVAANLSRDVHFIQTAFEVQMVPERTRLVADGRTRPVIALRVLDGHGRPVHAGISGDLTLSAPYESAEAVDGMQARALSGLGRAAPHWVVKGDDGVALVELAPTMVSGALQLDFDLADGRQRRHQTLNAWVVPGNMPWTLVGLAEGAAGKRSIADAMDRTGRFDSDLGDHARLAFYAKGRVRGSTLLTLAYDSAKQRDAQRLQGAIDPKAYYTIYADGSTRRFDAASRNKLYVRLESRVFYALFGDFDTGFSQSQLARYQRAMTGVKGEYHRKGVHAQAFAAKVASSHRHDEIQGAGISGPYALSGKAIVANSEQVSIEVRDRLRPEIVLSRQSLTRFTDYDIDLLAATIRFKQPVLSRDSQLNPQFIVIDYEVDTGLASGGAMNAGLRADWTTSDGKLRLGSTLLTDKGEKTRTEILGTDLRYRPNEATELRAEAAISRADGKTATAWLFEAERHDGRLSLLAYARSADPAFGVGQLSGAVTGRRKLGIDARLALDERLAVSLSAWNDQSLTDPAHQEAVRLRGEYRTRQSEYWLGASAVQDHLVNAGKASSVLLEGGATRRLLDGKLQLEAATSIGVGSAGAVEQPARSQFGLRYSLTSWAKVNGTFEVAHGGGLDTRTARVAIDLQAWRGGHLVSGIGRQDIAEQGQRSFAAFGLTQSIDVTRHLSIDGSIDMNKVLSGIDPSKIVNPAQPLPSGGGLSGSSALLEGFTAYTLGGSWRSGRWTTTARGEWRDGELANRRGVTFGSIRQLGEGRMVGSGLTWSRARGSDGSASEVFDGMAAMAWRSRDSRLDLLSKAEFRSDNLVASSSGASALLLAGSVFGGEQAARSRRVIGSVSANWSPSGRRRSNGTGAQLELGFFGAVRYKLDGYGDQSLSGTTLMTGIDLRVGLGERFELGGSATLRRNLGDGTTKVAFGPQIGFTPAKDMLLTVGYTFSGYRDRDFGAARATNKGLFATIKAKFDANSLGFLGLGRN